MSKDFKTSKLLSYLLRHGAQKHGIEMKSEGFIEIKELQKHEKLRNISISKLQEIVENDSKQRFTLKQQGNEWMIRANQGHSMDVEITFKRIVPSVCVHGTNLKAYEIIKNDGLRVMNRKYIHCAKSPSQTRKNSTVLIYINVELAISDGIEFYESENNVLLTKGIDGRLEPKYFANVEFRNS